MTTREWFLFAAGASVAVAVSTLLAFVMPYSAALLVVNGLSWIVVLGTLIRNEVKR